MKKIFLAICLVCTVFMAAAQHGVCAVNKIGDMKHKGGKLGPYHALIIGVDTYQDSNIPKLRVAGKGAKALSKVLKTRYGFSTELLLNKKATKEAVVKKIEALTGSVKKNGTVLIYFAGRGEVDAASGKGVWYPYDAKVGDIDTYITNEAVQASVRDMAARDVLVISDSVYMDTFFGSAHKLPRELDDGYYIKLYNKRSRWGLTSGNHSPDKKAKNLSRFTEQLVNTLKENNKPAFSMQELYEKIKPVIRKSAAKAPRCRSLRNTGDQGGELIFVLVPSAMDKAVAAAGAGGKTKNSGKKPAGKGAGDGSLSFSSNVKGAEIVVDGVVVGTTPLKKFVLPMGTHKIVVKKEGFQPFEKNILVKRGESVALTADLKKIVVKSTKGKLFIQAEPANAKIKFIGMKAPYSPGIELEQGTYKVEINAPFFEKQQKEYSVTALVDNKFSATLEPVKSFNHKLLGTFVLINPATFNMGSPNGESMRNKNETVHKVTLNRKIYMQSGELTVSQWRRFVKSSNYKTEAEAGDGAHILVDFNWEKDTGYNWLNPGFKQGDSHPVVCVSWNDTQAYIKWLNKKSKGISFRLPTEAEWEYAARSGSEKRFSFGECLSRDKANFDGNSKWGDCPVGASSSGTLKTGSFPANSFGLKDMHGNALEWCQDWFGNYPAGAVTDPVGPPSGTAKVVRGGGWTSYAYNARSAKRYSKSPDVSYSDIGFRLVVEIK